MTGVNANVNIVVNTQNAIAQIQGLQKQINALNRTLAMTGGAQDMRRVNQGLIDAANATGQFKASLVPVTSSVDQFTQKLEKNKFTLGEYTRYATSQLPGMSRVFRREFDTMQQVAESRVRKIATAYTALGEATGKAQKALALTPTGALDLKNHAVQAEIAAQRQAIFNKMLSDGSTRMLNWGKNTQWAGRQLMVGFSIPLAMLGTTAAKTFAELDKASISFKRVYGDLSTTTQEMERNLQAVKDLGVEYTKYGIAVSDTIDLASRAAATGATNETLMAATKETLRLATLGQMDYNTALDATISMQTAFQSSNEDLAKNIDFLNAVENQTVLTLQDMALAIPRVAPVVKGLGGDVKDLAIMMTAMREGGISAENGANALKSGLASLINPTKRAQETLQKFGIDLKGIIANTRGDVLATVQEFGKALGALDQFSQQQALEQIFGKYQYARMGALFSNIINDSGQAARAMDLAGESAQNLATLSEKELGKISESTSVKFQAAMEKLKVSVAPIGEQFMKAIMPIVDFFSKMFDKFNEMPDVIKNVVVIGSAALAGLGPVILMSIGLLANGLANITKGALLVRNAFQRLTGSHKTFEYMAVAELEATTATAQLEGKMGSLTGVMLNQQGAISRLITLYSELATAASMAAGRMPATMGGAAGATRAAAPRVRANKGLVMVPGSGNRDTVPAMLTPGESVMTKSATKKYAPILQSMNNGTLPGFNRAAVGIGSRMAQTMRNVQQRTTPFLSYISSPRKAPSAFQSIRRFFAPSVPEDVIQRAYRAGGGKKDLDEKRVKRYSRTAVAHIGKAEKHKEEDGTQRKGWTASGTRITATVENEALQNIFSSRSRSDQAYAIAGKSGLLDDPSKARILGDIIYGKRHPTSADEYSVAEELYGLLSSDRTFRKSLSADVLDQFILLKGLTLIRNGKVSTRGLGEDPYGIWSGEAKSIEQLISEQVKLGNLPGLNKGMVPGSGNKDTIPALLTPGESVITKEATAKYGPILQAMNKGKVRGFAEGDVDINDEMLSGQAGHFTRSQRVTDPQEVETMVRESRDAAIKAGRSVKEYDEILQAIVEGRKVEAKLYTNAIANIPNIANADVMTGEEFGIMLSGAANRSKMMDPLIDQIAKEMKVDVAQLRSNPDFMRAMDVMAEDVGMTLAQRGGDFVTTDDFNNAFNAAIDKKISTGQFSPEESAAIESVRTRKTRAQYYIDGRKKGGRKSIPGAGVAPYGMGGLPEWEGEFMTEQGIAARREAAKQTSQSSRRRATRTTPNLPDVTSKNVWDLTAKQQKEVIVQAREEAKRQAFLREKDKQNWLTQRRQALETEKLLANKQELIDNETEFLKTRGLDDQKAREIATRNIESGVVGSQIAEQRRINRDQELQRLADEANEIEQVERQSIRERRQERQEEARRRRDRIYGNRFGRALGSSGRFVGRHSMGLGMGVGMASALPLMMADEQGKFMGVDAGTTSMAMGGISGLLSIAPMLGPAAAPVLAVGAAAGALAIGLKIWRNNVDEASKKSAELGANIGGTANALNTMARVLGKQTPAQSQLMQQMAFTAEEEQNYGQFQTQLESEAGQAMLQDLANKTTAERVTQLTDYISAAIASGLMDKQSGQLFAKTVGLALQDSVLSTAVASAIRDQSTGVTAMLEKAQQRLSKVEASAAIAEVKGAPETGEFGFQKSIGTDVSAFAIGGAIQVIQDFSNVAAVARQEYANGTITYKEFIDAVRNATSVQEEYSNIVSKSVSNAVDMQAARQALDQQLLVGGMSQEQLDAITHATDIGISRFAAAPFGIGQGGQSAYRSDYVARQAEIQYNKSDSLLSDQERDLLLAESQKAQDAASTMFQNGLNEDLKIMVAAGKATAEQAAALGAELMNNSLSAAAQQYRRMEEQGRGILGLEQAAFMQTAEAIGIPGLTEGNIQRYIDIGLRFSEENGSIAEYQSFINNLPENIRLNIVTSLKGMTGQALAQTIQGGTDILGAFGQEYGSKVLMSRGVAAAREAVQSRAPRGTGGVSRPIDAQQSDLRAQEKMNKELIETAERFGEEKAYQLSIAADSLFNGKKVSATEWTNTLDKLSNKADQIESLFPPEIASKIKIDYTSPQELDLWSKSAEVFNRNYLTLQNLNPKIDLVASMKFLTIGADGEELTAAEVAENTAELNKAMSVLEKSKNKKLRKEAYVTIVSSTMLDIKNQATGENFTIEEATKLTNENMEELAKATGGKVYTAEPSVVQGALGLKLNADNLISEAAQLEKTAKALSAIPGMGGAGTELLNQAANLRKEAEQLNESAKFAVTTAPKETPTGGGGGGGGGAESPLKGFKQGILDQVKMWVDANAQMSDLNNAKKNFVQSVLKGNSLFAKLSGVKGVDVSRLQEILGMGPKGVKEFIDKYIKGGKLTKEGASLLDAAAISGAAQTIGEAVIARRTAGTQIKATRIARREKASKEVIDAIAGDPAKAAQLVAIQKKINQNVDGAVKLKERFIRSQERAVQKEKELAKAMDPAQYAMEEFNKYMEKNNAYFDKQFADIEANANILFKADYGKSVGEMELQIERNDDLIDKEKERIAVIQDSIRVIETRQGTEKNYSDWGSEQIQKAIDDNNDLMKILERRNEIDQRRIDAIQRESDLRSREIDVINRDLDDMSEAEDKINEAYDKRIEALDEVTKINDRIVEQQRQQIDLSRALSTGDIYSATAAAREMQASSAQFAAEQFRTSLEQGRENEISALRTSGGLTREQAEERIGVIEEQNYQASLRMRDIQDAIYNRQVNEILPLKDTEYNLNLALEKVQDSIAVKQKEIRDIERGKMEELQRQNDIMREQIDDHLFKIKEKQSEIKGLTGETKEEFDNMAKSIQAGNAWMIASELDTAAGAQQARNLAAQWANVAQQIENAKNALSGRRKEIGLQPLTKKYTAEDRAKDLAAAQAAYDAEISRIFSAAPQIKPEAIGGMGIQFRNAGGMIEAYRKGGAVGRDSVPAMLTPGEFVIRKAMVDKYGMPMFDAINQGSFSMPRYDTRTPSTGNVVVTTQENTKVLSPMYNNYSVNVNVSGTNASADDIANHTIMKIKQMQNMQIRGNRGY